MTQHAEKFSSPPVLPQWRSGVSYPLSNIISSPVRPMSEIGQKRTKLRLKCGVRFSSISRH
jgi:hypothetical protein